MQEVYTTLTCRKSHQNMARTLDNILCSEQCENNFKYIDNSSIEPSHVWKDGLHLNDEGLALLANNFINTLNGISRY